MKSSENMIFRLGELFSGPGGIALGAKRAKIEKDNRLYAFKHIWANDIDENSCKTYIRNICPDKPETVICKDVKELDIKSLEPIDAFAWGFPCNDFSIVGETKGLDGKYGPLYKYGVKILDYFKPKVFFAENVNGLKSANNGKAFESILYDLENAGNGYKLTVHTYKFEQYGVPQNRKRIIIIGIDKTLGIEFKVPAPTVLCPVTARQALEQPHISADAFNHEFTKQSKKVIERLMSVKPGENAWTADLAPSLQLNVKGAKMSQIYRRLHPDQPSYTITGSGGGGTHGYHWKENRALTNRERARIQTFPDDFIFEGSKESVRKQIGMAVSPKMAEIIFNSILKTFAGIKYDCVTNSMSDLKNQCFHLELI